MLAVPPCLKAYAFRFIRITETGSGSGYSSPRTFTGRLRSELRKLLQTGSHPTPAL